MSNVENHFVVKYEIKNFWMCSKLEFYKFYLYVKQDIEKIKPGIFWYELSGSGDCLLLYKFIARHKNSFTSTTATNYFKK